MKIKLVEVEEQNERGCSITIKVDNNGVASAETSGGVDYNSALMMLRTMALATTKIIMPEYTPNARGIKLLMTDIIDCASEGMEIALEGEDDD